MSINYLHNHPDFDSLIRILADDLSISPVLVEKDYWIMHCLFGLQAQGMIFQLKGGTSLSKGFKIIDRFSEDIDVLIVPPANIEDKIGTSVYTGRNHDKPSQRESRSKYFDWLAGNIKINGIISIERDSAFDDSKYRSGGIRLYYRSTNDLPKDIKEGILLEVGFDDVTPNTPIIISSWAYDYATTKVDIMDNRAKNIPCYNPGYTFVEKLQTISTKFRKQQQSGKFFENFMRHYYDIYCLLKTNEIIQFIQTNEYSEHKAKRFRESDNPKISENEAFILSDKTTREFYKIEYDKSQSLYYKNKPTFDDILNKIHQHIFQL